MWAGKEGPATHSCPGGSLQWLGPTPCCSSFCLSPALWVLLSLLLLDAFLCASVSDFLSFSASLSLALCLPVTPNLFQPRICPLPLSLGLWVACHPCSLSLSGSQTIFTFLSVSLSLLSLSISLSLPPALSPPLSFHPSPSFPRNLPVRDFWRHPPQEPALGRRGMHPPAHLGDPEICKSLCGGRAPRSHPRSPKPGSPRPLPPPCRTSRPVAIATGPRIPSPGTAALRPGVPHGNDTAGRGCPRGLEGRQGVHCRGRRPWNNGHPLPHSPPFSVLASPSILSPKL